MSEAAAEVATDEATGARADAADTAVGAPSPSGEPHPDVPADLNPTGVAAALAGVNVTIDGAEVPILDVLRFTRCRSGKPVHGCQGRGFSLVRQTVRAKATLTLCGCAINGWRKARVIPAATALTPARAAQEERGEEVVRDRVKGKRLALEAARGELEAILTATGQDIGELAQELATLEAREGLARGRAAEAAEWVRNLEQRIAEMQKLRDKAHADGVSAFDEEVELHARAVVVRAKIDQARERRGPEERAARRKVDKLERRIETYIAYHPEAVSVA